MKVRFVSVGGDGFSTSRTAQGNSVGLFSKVTIIPSYGGLRLAAHIGGDQKKARNVLSGETFTAALLTGGEHQANLKRQLTFNYSALDKMKPAEVLAA